MNTLYKTFTLTILMGVLFLLFGFVAISSANAQTIINCQPPQGVVCDVPGTIYCNGQCNLIPAGPPGGGRNTLGCSTCLWECDSGLVDCSGTCQVSQAETECNYPDDNDGSDGIFTQCGDCTTCNTAGGFIDCIGATNPSTQNQCINGTESQAAMAATSCGPGLESNQCGDCVNADNIPVYLNYGGTQTGSIDFDGSATIGGDILMSDNTSISLTNGSASTTLLIGNWAEPGFNYSTVLGANLAVEGDVKANRLCIEEDCRDDWSTIVSGGLWTLSGNGTDVYYNGGNVGIGTSAPPTSVKLGVDGGIEIGASTAGESPGTISFSDTNPPTGVFDFYGLTTDGTTDSWVSLTQSGGGLWIQNGDDISNGNTGNVNIGGDDILDTYQLYVEGTTHITGTLSFPWDQNANIKVNDPLGTAPGRNLNIAAGDGNVAFGNSDVNGGSVYINPGKKSGDSSVFNGNIILANLRGMVGIGTVAPNVKLVVGDGVDTVGNIIGVNGTANSYTGYRIDNASSEKWFIGMDNSTSEDLILKGTASLSDVRLYNDLSFDYNSGVDKTISVLSSPATHGADLLIHAGDIDDQQHDWNGGDVHINGGIGSPSASGPNNHLDGRIILSHNGSRAMGNVGIGTDNPGVPLDVFGSIRSSGKIISQTANIAGINIGLSGDIKNNFGVSPGPDGYNDIYVRAESQTGPGAEKEGGDVYIHGGESNDGDGPHGDIILAESFGNVGIGVGAPDEKLEVAGKIIAEQMIDRNDSNYIVNPSGTSVFNGLTVGGSDVCTASGNCPTSAGDGYIGTGTATHNASANLNMNNNTIDNAHGIGINNGLEDGGSLSLFSNGHPSIQLDNNTKFRVFTSDPSDVEAAFFNWGVGSGKMNLTVDGKAAFGGWGIDSVYDITTPDLYAGVGEFSNVNVASTLTVAGSEVCTIANGNCDVGGDGYIGDYQTHTSNGPLNMNGYGILDTGVVRIVKEGQPALLSFISEIVYGATIGLSGKDLSIGNQTTMGDINIVTTNGVVGVYGSDLTLNENSVCLKNGNGCPSPNRDRIHETWYCNGTSCSLFNHDNTTHNLNTSTGVLEITCGSSYPNVITGGADCEAGATLSNSKPKDTSTWVLACEGGYVYHATIICSI